MKKIAILTINDDWNYGNRLQNYAVQEALKKQGVKVETVPNQKGIYGIKYIKKNIKKFIKIILPIKKFNDRYGMFNKFNMKNIKYSKFGIDENHIPKKLGKRYDCFFAGSDQVWNPNFGRMSDIDFLTFAPKEKRNSFSASFGISEIPDNLKEYYIEKLKELSNISVREERGKEIIEELTARKDVEVLLDPTMLLSAEEWDKVSKKPRQLKNNKYILNYFLGELSKERMNEINRIAEKNNCEVINILEPDNPFYQTGPSEFLYLEKNAFLICTDSFHSCVFAIIYNRPFIVFDREDNFEKMNSRIETLLNKFRLQERYCTGKMTEQLLNCDYTETYEILERERERAKQFLNNALK